MEKMKGFKKLQEPVKLFLLNQDGAFEYQDADDVVNEVFEENGMQYKFIGFKKVPVMKGN